MSEQYIDNDTKLGMAWWNNLTQPERARALRDADTAIVAVAWEFWKKNHIKTEPS